ncbi:O-antigen ligase [Volucribacter psittacicida]|uniref:O-antigen ligase n=1 Tax=Volucribacter psittacicida TaxID=203482 RepID=A0A4R1G2R2_9PAST|nr:O-antigen ligase family protein [Volucribacter psittacicida]TCJ97981.1 O-antigen ligase [Volucribacter psittacicida]
MLKKYNLTHFTTILVSFFFLAVLLFAKGYNYSPFILSIISVIYLIHFLIKKNKIQVPKLDKLIIYSYIFYFLTFLPSVIIHSDKAKVLDNPAKILLFLPLLLLFKKFPIKTHIILHTIPFGAFIAGLVAIYQRFILHKEQAFYTHMHIQGGDIAMSVAMFSIIATLYFAIKKQYKLTALYTFFSLMGILAGFLSTARGAWIGLPFILLFIFFVYRQYLPKKTIMGFIAIIAIIIGGASLVPNTSISHRFHQATHEIIAYFDKGNGSTSVGARFDMWKSALLQAQQKPILGWGLQGVMENRLELGKQGIISEYASQFSHAHNQYLDDLSKRGIIGLIALLAVLLIPFSIFIKSINKENLEQTTIALLGCVHIISVAFYFISQGFLVHNSGTVFYFFLIIVFYAMLQQKLKNLS